MTSMSDPEGLHKEHRCRMRARFLNEGLDSFAAHEVLELLLFYCIPRQNTNPTGHQLLRRFGSLSGVFEASYTELLSVPGVSDATAVYITFISQLFARCRLDSVKPSKRFTDITDIARFCALKYIGAAGERLSVLTFDNDMHLLRMETLSEGEPSLASFSYRKLFNVLCSTDCAGFILVHNHNSENPRPSSEDMALTLEILKVSELFGIKFLEHIVLSGDRFYPILSMKENNWSF